MYIYIYNMYTYNIHAYIYNNIFFCIAFPPHLAVIGFLSNECAQEIGRFFCGVAYRYERIYWPTITSLPSLSLLPPFLPSSHCLPLSLLFFSRFYQPRLHFNLRCASEIFTSQLLWEPFLVVGGRIVYSLHWILSLIILFFCALPYPIPWAVGHALRSWLVTSLFLWPSRSAVNRASRLNRCVPSTSKRPKVCRSWTTTTFSCLCANPKPTSKGR